METINTAAATASPPLEKPKPPVTAAQFKALSSCNFTSAKPARKWQRILSAFIEGQTLNRFEAERIGDHCLHTSVSDFERDGIHIDRCEEVVDGRFGKCRVMRYWLAKTADNVRRAKEKLVGQPSAERGYDTA